jgi:hypothetical protein
MKTFTLISFLLYLATISSAQDKAPIAENDFFNAMSLRTDTLRVLENDFAYDEHPFKLVQVLTPMHGEIDWDDSLVYYTPGMHFKGADSLKYRILDLENNLMSELATVYLDVENKSYDTLTTNNIHCRINACGTQFWNMDDIVMFEAPANSGLNPIFTQSMWMGAFDQDEVLHVAADMYRFGTDFFPGPVLDSINYTPVYDVNWNRVWKLHQSDIDYHRSHWQDAGYTMLENISDWPAAINPELAPFLDIDSNGEYNPANGDFPLIKGDQAIYFVFNDDRDEHTQTEGAKLALEIHAMYYAFDRPNDSSLNNTIFASYNIINKSDNNYHDYYIGFYNDFDIGCPWDDYVGTDTVLNSLYGYNSTPIDCSNQYPVNYGSLPPAISFTALDFKIAATMTFYGTWNTPTSDPIFPHDYYNYLKAIWRDSTHLTIGEQGYGGTEPINFIYPGNPITGEGWSEVSENNEINDRRSLLSAGPYNLNAGESIEIEFALVFARAYTGLNLPNLNSVELLKERITEVQVFYNESLGEEEFQLPQMEVEIYPNPFDNFITIKSNIDSQNLSYSIFDILGEKVGLGKIQNNNQSQINLKKLDKGIYFIRVVDGESFLTRKIIKN